MRRTADTYVGRVTPWQSGHARFEGTVRVSIAPIADAGSVAASLPAAFDLDVAIGVQLDATGAWVGRDRNVRIPIPQPWFAWGDAVRGWGQGVWKGPFSGQFGVYRLDDETYRRLLRANIIAKRWDGTIPGAQAAFDAFFIDPETFVFVQDKAQVPYPASAFAWGIEGRGWRQASWRGAQTANDLGKVDVAMTICIAGKIPSQMALGLLAQNAIPIKPGGVSVAYRITSVDRRPIFGFGVQNKYVSGWGTGAWAVPPEFLLDCP